MPNYSLNEFLSVTHRLCSGAARDIYGIPFIEKQAFPIDEVGSSVTLCKYNNCRKKTPLIRDKIGHGFMFDKDFASSFSRPISFIKKMSVCAAWATPDCTIDMQESEALAIGVVEKTRWLGRLGQEYGQTVFATVGWSRKELDDICFAGLRDGAIFVISTLGVKNNEAEKDFLRGYLAMRNRYPNSTIISVGQRIDGMDDDVCYVPYSDSFGYENFQQLRLFSWRNIPAGGEEYGK